MASRKHDMDMFCKGCIYDPADAGSWRQQVEKCNSGPNSKVPCRLWAWRPITMETMLRNRKEKGAAGVDLDALIEGLDDDEDVTSAVAA